MGALIDLTGKKFGRLTVIERSVGKVKSGKQAKVFWSCICECGNYCDVDGYRLRAGITNSCGCLFTDTITKHGDSNEHLYKVWSAMKDRCNNQNCKHYKYYGGKGIRVCDEWGDYSIFKKWALSSGYYQSMTIDRIDPSKDYCPENCRWISKSENSKRTAKNLLTVNGITKSYTEWERHIGMGKMSIEHWVERHGEQYAIRRIDATINPEKYGEKEISELGINKNKRKYVTINGGTLSFSAWAKKIGKSHSAVRYWVEKHGEEYAIQRILSSLAGAGE